MSPKGIVRLLQRETLYSLDFEIQVFPLTEQALSDEGATGYGAAAEEGGDGHSLFAGELDFEKAEGSVGC